MPSAAFGRSAPAAGRRLDDIDHIDSQSIASIGIVEVYLQPGGDIAAAIAQITGPLAEVVVRPRDPNRFRRWIFTMGLVFSVLLPWAIPCNAWYQFLGVSLRR